MNLEVSAPGNSSMGSTSHKFMARERAGRQDGGRGFDARVRVWQYFLDLNLI